MAKILIIENDRELLSRILTAMTELGYDVIAVSERKAAVSAFENSCISLIIADYSCDGCEICSELRASGSSVPVIVITNLISRHEKRVIFRSGADGYMFPPVDMEELQMRVRSLLWRCHIVDDATLSFGSCKLISEDYLLETPTESIELRKMEFLLLQKLLSYPAHVFSRTKLMDEVWGYDSDSDPRTVDTHIKRLRQKLKTVDDIKIQTVRGLGYRALLPKSRKKY